MCTKLKEKEAKVQKRDQQLSHLVSQYKKLDTAYTKLRASFKEKMDVLKSKEKQVDYLNAMAACSSRKYYFYDKHVG